MFLQLPNSPCLRSLFGTLLLLQLHLFCHHTGTVPLRHPSFERMPLKLEMTFLVPLHRKPKRRTRHIHKGEKRQTDASVEHLGCYLTRISLHKGTFIGLPSICGVQEQTLDSSDRWWSYQGRGGGEGGEERVRLVRALEQEGLLSYILRLLLPSVWYLREWADGRTQVPGLLTKRHFELSSCWNTMTNIF